MSLRVPLRVLVIGSGIAGLTTALAAARAGHDVTIATKAELDDTATARAQGGIAAVLTSGAPEDSVAAHVRDTLAAGAGLGDPRAIRVLCGAADARIRELVELGVGFDRVEAGAAAPGDGFARGLEAAHSHARILHSHGDGTGREIQRAMSAAARAAAEGGELHLIEHAFLADLEVRDGVAVGAWLQLTGDAAPTLVLADAVVLATGGAGQLYAHTSNPEVATGDGIAAAARAGARLADLEFVQFHPTVLADSGGALVSEAVRGEGAVLVNERGERFLTAVHPDAELAPRDVVARGIADEMARQGGRPVHLDARHLGRGFLERRFPTITARIDAAGLDWSRDVVPVTPAAHYLMGGVVTDTRGRTSIPGLYAAGETARTGVHGANRLASNSLLEGVVFGDRVAEALDHAARRRDADHFEGSAAPARLDSANLHQELPHLGHPTRRVGAPPFSREALQALMWSHAGLHRNEDGLTSAQGTLEAWASALAQAPVDASIPASAREDSNLLELARRTVAAALARGESIGAHFRSDAPVAAGVHPRELPRESQKKAMAHAC